MGPDALQPSALTGVGDPDSTSVPPGRLADLRKVGSGKVREIYQYGDDLLMVASDRISAYDVVMDDPIPDKGRVLTEMSAFWFTKTEGICPNHLIGFDVPDEVAGRSMVVEKLEMWPVECVVRGYLSGSAWREYQASGSICGVELPDGLRESDRLERPIFTPATKAEVGDHDENVDFETAARLVGDPEIAAELERLSIAIYSAAAEHALSVGMILADTKFEFGRSGDREIVLADEVLTPDSSRFWPAADYEPGRPQASFDKQYLRDWLDASGWDHSPPPPRLPAEVVAGTRQRYLEALDRITGRP